MVRRTTYYNAVHWLHNEFVMCNNVPSIDPGVWDNMRSSLTWEDNDGCEHETEIYQWFITNASEGDVRFLEKSFGLLFTYSDVLDCFILCVDHWGTDWHGVGCDCYNDGISDSLLKDDKEF